MATEEQSTKEETRRIEVKPLGNGKALVTVIINGVIEVKHEAFVATDEDIAEFESIKEELKTYSNENGNGNGNGAAVAAE